MKLRPGREKSLLRRHPWIFSGAVAALEGDPAPGSVVEVQSSKGKFLARAAYSPASQLTGRVWSFDRAETIDAAFFRRRIARAAALRRELGLDAPEGGCRLIFSESDGLPGVIADRFGSHLVIQLGSAGADFFRSEIVEALTAELRPEAIYERSDASVRRKEGLAARCGLLSGDAWPEELVVEENGLRFAVDPRYGQKTGFYFDLRTARARLEELSRGRRVLNAFCYTGSFAVAALRGGASEVLNIDSSGPALRQLERNYALNELSFAPENSVEGDVFTELRRLDAAGEKFDLVVLDPPKLIDSQKALARGCRAYQDLARLGFRLLAPGGMLCNFSCSGLMTPDLFQKITASAALEAGVDARIVGDFRQAPDHPVLLSVPESFYLKGLLSVV